MIERVEFRNLKALRKVDLTFSQFTVIVGANGSGKTTALQGLRTLARLGEKPPPLIFRGNWSHHEIQTVGCNDGTSMALWGQWHNTRGSIKVDIVDVVPPSADGDTETGYELTGTWGSENVDLAFVETNSQIKWRYGRRGSPLLRAISSARFLQLDPRRVAEPWGSAGPTTEIAENGSRLPGLLAEMAATNPDSFRDLQEAVAGVLPFAKSLRLRRVKVEKEEGADEWGFRLAIELAQGGEVAAYHVSDGTLIVVALLAAVFSPSRPTLLLIDDLDHGLHPKAQSDLLSQLRKVLSRFPDLQIVATSHSPYLLDDLRPEEVRLMTLLDDGSAVCAELTEHPDFKRWRGQMMPGEFWSSVGEGWIKDLVKKNGNE